MIYNFLENFLPNKINWSIVTLRFDFDLHCCSGPSSNFVAKPAGVDTATFLAVKCFILQVFCSYLITLVKANHHMLSGKTQLVMHMAMLKAARFRFPTKFS
jgi:hypothetical protein